MRFTTFALALAATAGLAAAAQAAPNLVVNGGFELSSNGPNNEFDRDTVFTGWTSNGYNFGFAPGTADTTGSNTSQYGNLQLWGLNNGGLNAITESSYGGNFVAADGAFQVSPIQQTLVGLVVGKQYTVAFDWAAAQQRGFDGDTTEQWMVSLGGQTISTAVYSNPSHGFSGWMHENFTFTFDGANNVLSFLAVGTPDGKPPFSLLDGVSATAAVPEPATWGLMIAGFGLVGFAARRRNTTVAA